VEVELLPSDALELEEATLEAAAWLGTWQLACVGPRLSKTPPVHSCTVAVRGRRPRSASCPEGLPPFEAGQLGLTSAGLERAALAGAGASLPAFNGGGYKLSSPGRFLCVLRCSASEPAGSLRSPSPARLSKAAMTQLSRGEPGLRLPLSPWPGEFDMCDTTELVLRLFFNGSHRGSYEVPIV
jgi:hypothetical protein